MVWKISQRLKIICPPVLSSSHPTFSKQQSTWTARKQIPLCPASQSVGQGRKGNVNDVANCTERPSELLVTLLKLQQHRVACFLSQSQWSWHLSTKFSLTVSVNACLGEADTLPPNFPLQFQWRAVSVKLTPFHQTFPYSFSEGLSWRAVPVKLTLSNFPFQFQIRANGLLIQYSQRNGQLAVKISL